VGGAEKGNLRKVIQEASLSWWHKVKIALDISRGMEFLHKYRLIHRDLKPPNILLGISYDVYIADFGTTCFFDKSTSTLKESLIGTPGTFGEPNHTLLRINQPQPLPMQSGWLRR
jgi:serine/threonine protein kinase